MSQINQLTSGKFHADARPESTCGSEPIGGVSTPDARFPKPVVTSHGHVLDLTSQFGGSLTPNFRRPGEENGEG